MTQYMLVQKCIHCNKTPCSFLKGPIVELQEEIDDIEGMIRRRDTYKGEWSAWEPDEIFPPRDLPS